MVNRMIKVLMPSLLVCMLSGYALVSQAANNPPPSNSSSQSVRAYGILPFVKTVSQQTQDNLNMSYDDFETVLQTTLSQDPNSLQNVQYLTGEQPLDYFSSDFSQRIDANQRIHSLSQSQKRNVLIFGSLQESSGKDAIELSVVAYFASKNHAFLAFYNERIKHKGGVQKKSQPKHSYDIMDFLGGSELPSKFQQKLKAEQLAKNVKQWFIEIDAIMNQTTLSTNAQPSGQQPLVWTNAVFLPGQVKTLKDIYIMLYKQEHYVHIHSSDEPILQEIAQENGINLSQLKDKLTQHWRQRKYIADANSCEMRGIVSVPQNNKGGMVYKLCFEPSYLEKNNWHCPPTGNPPKVIGKMRQMTRKQVNQEIAKLNAKSQFKDWRLPTIDELFALISLLPEPSAGEVPLTFWSATVKQKTIGWGLSTDVISVRNIAKVYRTYVTSLAENDSAFVIPVRNCPQLRYPYIWQ